MITTIFATHSAVESLTVGNALTVTAPSGGAGFVQRVFNAATVDETAIDSASSHTFGPYAVVMQFRIGCSAVSVAFSQAPATDSLAPTEGGGAAAFTDLTDAPATITAGALMVGNPEGDAVAFTDNLTWDGDAKILMLTTDDSNGGQLGATSETGSGRAAVYADNTYASVVCNASVPLGAAGSILLEAYADGTAGLTMGEGDFFMAGFDVAATDAAATMTVDAVEYSIAKAIKVKIGSDTYFWPLFGPVAP